jgi:hypothetical protein
MNKTRQGTKDNFLHQSVDNQGSIPANPEQSIHFGKAALIRDIWANWRPAD